MLNSACENSAKDEMKIKMYRHKLRCIMTVEIPILVFMHLLRFGLCYRSILYALSCTGLLVLGKIKTYIDRGM